MGTKSVKNEGKNNKNAGLFVQDEPVQKVGEGSERGRGGAKNTVERFS